MASPGLRVWTSTGRQIIDAVSWSQYMRRTLQPDSAVVRCLARSASSTAASSPSPAARQDSKGRSSTPLAQTFYELFPKTLSSGPPPSGPFSVDARQLRREFLQLQALAHPDRHAPALKIRAEAASARINDAYNTLRDPLRRALYLLGLRGIDVAGDEAAKVEDQELLLLVLELREQIEEAEDESELQEAKAENDSRIEQSVRLLEEAFRRDDLDVAKREVIRLRYWVNVKDSLDGWEKGKPVTLIH